MLNRCASYILCKRGALHEAMRSVGRVGVRAARAQKAACLLVSYCASKDTVAKRSGSVLPGGGFNKWLSLSLAGLRPLVLAP